MNLDLKDRRLDKKLPLRRKDYILACSKQKINTAYIPRDNKNDNQLIWVNTAISKKVKIDLV